MAGLCMCMCGSVRRGNWVHDEVRIIIIIFRTEDNFKIYIFYFNNIGIC